MYNLLCIVHAMSLTTQSWCHAHGLDAIHAHAMAWCNYNVDNFSRPIAYNGYRPESISEL